MQTYKEFLAEKASFKTFDQNTIEEASDKSLTKFTTSKKTGIVNKMGPKVDDSYKEHPFFKHAFSTGAKHKEGRYHTVSGQAYYHDHSGPKHELTVTRDYDGQHLARLNRRSADGKTSIGVGEGRGATSHEALDHALKNYKYHDFTHLKGSPLDESVLKEFHATPAGKEVSGAVSDQGALKYVKHVNGKYALVSRHTGRPLKYFKDKPSSEEADKALRAVEFFKHEELDVGGSLVESGGHTTREYQDWYNSATRKAHESGYHHHKFDAETSSKGGAIDRVILKDASTGKKLSEYKGKIFESV